MKIIKLKWGLYSIRDVAGAEIAVANSFSEAKKLINKLLTNRTSKINNKK